VPLRPVHEHPWDPPPAAPRALQDRLSGQAELRDRPGSIGLVAGIDIGFEDGGGVTRAAVAVLRQGDLRLAESGLARRPTTFPCPACCRFARSRPRSMPWRRCAARPTC